VELVGKKGFQARGNMTMQGMEGLQFFAVGESAA
jgi:hypothetical protein